MIPSDGSTPQSFFNSDVSLFIYYKVLIEGGRPIMLYFLKHSISSNY